MVRALLYGTSRDTKGVLDVDKIWTGDTQVSKWEADRVNELENKRIVRPPLRNTRGISAATAREPKGHLLTAFHGTHIRAAMSMLHDGFLKPKPWNGSGSGTHCFYCLCCYPAEWPACLMKCSMSTNAWDSIATQGDVYGRGGTAHAQPPETRPVVRPREQPQADRHVAKREHLTVNYNSYRL